MIFVFSLIFTIFFYSYVPVGRSFFSPTLGPTASFGDGLECWKGFYQSIRPTQMGLSLNIGTSYCDSVLLRFVFAFSTSKVEKPIK